MKKYLLTSLLWVFVLFGAFASAEDYSVVWNDIEYSPSSFTTEWWVFSYSSYSPNVWVDWDYYIFSVDDSNSQHICCDELTPGDSSIKACSSFPSCQWYELSAWTYSVYSDDMTFNSVSFSVGSSSVWWDDSWWSLLPNWESDLSWIISWLSDTINEFIPYLVYLGLWIITALIWFVAIRWLINRTSSKVRWTFSSWRRRR